MSGSLSPTRSGCGVIASTAVSFSNLKLLYRHFPKPPFPPSEAPATQRLSQPARASEAGAFRGVEKTLSCPASGPQAGRAATCHGQLRPLPRPCTRPSHDTDKPARDGGRGSCLRMAVRTQQSVEICVTDFGIIFIKNIKIFQVLKFLLPEPYYACKRSP